MQALALFVLVSLAIAALPEAAGQSPAPAALQAALDRARSASDAPAVAAAVVEDGRLIWDGASGQVEVGGARRADNSTLFPLASLTKLVTATMVIALRDEGRLRLDDRLARFVPTLPNASRITLRMLLNHTSGLGDYEDSAAIERKLEDPAHAWTRAEVLAAAGDSQFSPGTRYEYSNTGYVALGAAIERASGTTVQAVFQRLFATPLGLTRCTFARDPALMPAVAVGHSARGRRLFALGAVPTDTWGEVWTDGGLACTARDTARLLDAVFAGRVIARASLEEMLPARGRDYGMGIESRDGWVGHAGSYGGFESEGWHHPARRLTIVTLANREDVEAASAAWDAVAAALPRR